MIVTINNCGECMEITDPLRLLLLALNMFCVEYYNYMSWSNKAIIKRDVTLIMKVEQSFCTSRSLTAHYAYCISFMFCIFRFYYNWQGGNVFAEVNSKTNGPCWDFQEMSTGT